MKWKYFTEEEFIASRAAFENKIDNSLPKEYEANRNEILTILDGFREEFGEAIYITSGYRCLALNKTVGGVKNSSHLYGYAVDLQCKSGAVWLFNHLRDYLFKNHIEFDQLIFEKSRNTFWVHFAIKRYDGSQRKEVFDLVL